MILTMLGDQAIQKSMQLALRNRLKRQADAKGYVCTVAENLVDGVSLEQFEDDLRGGDGDELRGKFCAVHSSTALAVNCFAWFKPADRLPLLHLLDARGARSLSFERKFRIFRGGKAPNLDVWIEHDQGEIAIESKLTEHFAKKPPKFSPAYDRLAPPGLAEPCWWQVYERAKQAKSGYLDIAQLVKHYFGLRKYQQAIGQAKQLIFLYLYWEPINWQDIHPCRRHRKEVEQLIAAVKDSEISFQAMTYNQLWHVWSEISELVQHSRNLRDRYEVSL